MYLAHYIIPIILYLFKKNKIMLYGLLAGNIIDIDHIYLRVIGEVPWFESACTHGIGTQCSYGYYPLHNTPALLIMAVISVGLLISTIYYEDNKKLSFAFWLVAGAILHLLLDFIHFMTGFAF